jgi:hypothetical protein
MKKFYEKDLEEIIFNTSEERLEERGLFIYGKKYRQVKIPGYGIADLLFVKKINFDYPPFESYLSISIVELKEDKIGVSAFFQAIKYARGIQRYLRSRNFCYFSLRIILIGSELDKTGSLCFLPDLFCDCPNNFNDFETISGIEFYEYSYDFNGIMFKEKRDFVTKSDNYDNGTKN